MRALLILLLVVISSPSLAQVKQTCDQTKAISQAASTDIITPNSPNNFLYVCSITFSLSDAETVSVVEGTGSTCGTGTKALIGATTAANGMSVPLGGNVNLGSGSPFVWTQVAGDHLCILQSGTGRLSGVINFLEHNP